MLCTLGVSKYGSDVKVIACCVLLVHSLYRVVVYRHMQLGGEYRPEWTRSVRVVSTRGRYGRKSCCRSRARQLKTCKMGGKLIAASSLMAPNRMSTIWACALGEVLPSCSAWLGRKSPQHALLTGNVKPVMQIPQSILCSRWGLSTPVDCQLTSSNPWC